VKTPKKDIDWTKVKDNKVDMVSSEGKVVEWRNSEVTVIEVEDGNKKHTAAPDDGILELQSGWQLYIVGGKFVTRD
jgi:hypothetical protein